MNRKSALSALVNTIHRSNETQCERSNVSGDRCQNAEKGPDAIQLDRMEAALRQMLQSAEVRENELRERLDGHFKGGAAIRDLRSEVEAREAAVLRAEKSLDLRERLLKESEALRFEQKKAAANDSNLRDMREYLDYRYGTWTGKRRIAQ